MPKKKHPRKPRPKGPRQRYAVVREVCMDGSCADVLHHVAVPS